MTHRLMCRKLHVILLFCSEIKSLPVFMPAFLSFERYFRLFLQSVGKCISLTQARTPCFFSFLRFHAFGRISTHFAGTLLAERANVRIFCRETRKPSFRFPRPTTLGTQMFLEFVSRKMKKIPGMPCSLFFSTLDLNTAQDSSAISTACNDKIWDQLSLQTSVGIDEF